MTVKTKTKPTTTKTVTTTAKLTAFLYLRVSTPSQEVEEQVKMIRQYAADHGIEIIGQYGDCQKRQQEQVKPAVETGGYIQKAEAIRSLIECIVCHWATVPTTDKRYKTGVKTGCRAVTIRSKETAKTTAGQPIETMTIETPSA